MFAGGRRSLSLCVANNLRLSSYDNAGKIVRIAHRNETFDMKNKVGLVLILFARYSRFSLCTKN